MIVPSLLAAATDHATGAAWGGVTLAGVADLVAAIALLGGIFFLVVGAIGVYRLPDAYHRLHAASKCTTLGLTGMLLAMCLHIAEPIVVSKALITIVLTFVATPIGSHLIAKAAHHAGLPLWERTLSDELAQDKADPNMAVSDDFIGAPGLDGAWAEIGATPGARVPVQADGRGAA